MYKAVKLEAFCDFAEKHGNIKGNVLSIPIKQPKGSLDIYTLESSFCIPQLSGTFGVVVGRTPEDDWRQSLPSSFKTLP